MNSKNNILIRKRRGLSSIVGALLFVVLMVSAFAVFGVALNSQTNIATTSQDVADASLKKQLEDYSVSSVVQEAGGFLQVNATNQGQNPVEIFTLVITNKTDTGEPTKTIEIPSETAFLTTNTDEATNIVETLNLKMALAANPGDPDREYDLKLVSSLGTIKKLKLFCDDVDCGKGGGPVGAGKLKAQLFLDGPTGINTKTSTIIMMVTNTGDATMTGVEPDVGVSDCSDILFSATGNGTFATCNYESSTETPATLLPGQSVFFIWDGTIEGDIGNVLTFCNNAFGYDPALVNGDTPDPCDTLEIIDPNDCGGCEGGPGGETQEKLILIDDLLIRPSIFMVIPSPMGDASSSLDDKVMFGVNVVNPTDSTIKVNKVVVSVFAPGANNNDSLFLAPTPSNPNVCEAEDLSSFNGTNAWSCPGENQLMWKRSSDPVVLEPFSAETFMTKVLIGGAGRDLEGVLIQTSVFTTFGSFGKGNYQTTMSENFAPIMSIYMSPTVDSLADADRLANRQNIDHAVPQQFNIVLADTDLKTTTWLQPGARFIINVPREWSAVNYTGSSGIVVNATQPSVQTFGDDSTQIIGITSEAIGKCTADPCALGTRHAATISFEAMPPNKNVDRLYIMYALADGEANVDDTTPYDFSSGPLNEIILQVNSNQTGP